MSGELVRAGALLLMVALFAGTAWTVVRAAFGQGSWSTALLPALACVILIAWFRRVTRE